MAYTNSPLAVYTRISPNRNSPRNMPITKITVHHIAGVCSLEQFGNIVANPARQMSANYAIGNDGRIGLFCPEADRSWCSSSPWNDHQAITIEVSNCEYGDVDTDGDGYAWSIGPAAYNSLIELCVDICKRNGIKKLEFTGDKNGSLTYHYMFAATGCPGPWMKAHTQDLCDKVNSRLGASTSTPLGLYTVKLDTGTPIYDTPDGAIVGEISASTKYTIVEEKTIDGYKYGKLKSGAGWVILEKPEEKPSTPVGKKVSYTVHLDASDTLYDGPNGSKKGTVGTTGVFTMVEELVVDGTKYGKLKSGIGWVVVKENPATAPSPAPAQTAGFKVGDLVKINMGAVYYNGASIPDWVKQDRWYISYISGNRAVLGENEARNRNIQSPVNTIFLNKVSGGSTSSSSQIKVGDWVKVTNNIIYGTNTKFVMFVPKYKVLELNGDRAVISSDGRNVTTAISVKNIQKI